MGHSQISLVLKVVFIDQVDAEGGIHLSGRCRRGLSLISLVLKGTFIDQVGAKGEIH